MRPNWDRLEDWARSEASAYLDIGLQPHPTLLFFEGEDATLYVRGGAKYATSATDDQALRWNELFGMGMVIHPEGAALMTPTRLRTDADGSLAGEAEGESGVFVGWARRRDAAPPEQGGVILTYGLDDAGRPEWNERIELPEGGPFSTYLAATVTGQWHQAGRTGSPGDVIGMTPAGIAYALSRFGFSIGVDPGWYGRYGLDEPLPPRELRPEDRRRARRIRQARRSGTGARS